MKRDRHRRVHERRYQNAKEWRLKKHIDDHFYEESHGRDGQDYAS